MDYGKDSRWFESTPVTQSATSLQRRAGYAYAGKAATSKPSRGASPPNWLWFGVTFRYRNPGEGANSWNALEQSWKDKEVLKIQLSSNTRPWLFAGKCRAVLLATRTLSNKGRLQLTTG